MRETFRGSFWCVSRTLPAIKRIIKGAHGLMETVQLQCGHCKKVMAISVEHLGAQVKCPHCQGLVQTPPPAPLVESPIPNMDLNQRESIFAGMEASDAVLGESAAAKVELPSPPVPMDAPSAQTDPSASAEPDADLTTFKRRPVYDKSVFALIALIFLIPYAIVTTLFILYLLFVQGGRGHPLDYLRDPAPGKDKGGPRTVYQPAYNHPLAAHQKTTLGNSIQVGKDGDLLITPERVVLTDEGDLKLYLRARNVSSNTAFEPANDSWLRYDPDKKGEPPYTFLESKSRAVGNIYGAYLGYLKNSRDKDDAQFHPAALKPGEETTIVLRTAEVYQKTQVAAIANAKSPDTYTWHVQLRRGFVKWRGKDVPATAVIGVEFTSAQIERAGKKG
jgi:phage FluMu protein Com